MKVTTHVTNIHLMMMSSLMRLIIACEYDGQEIIVHENIPSDNISTDKWFKILKYNASDYSPIPFKLS